MSLLNIGVVHFKLEDFSLALENYLEALKIKEEINYSYDMEALLVNIGLCYNQLGDYKNARKYFNKAIAICGSIAFGKKNKKRGVISRNLEDL